MNIKKLLGKFVLFLSSKTINLAPASALGVGIEEMPESIKGLR